MRDCVRGGDFFDVYHVITHIYMPWNLHKMTLVQNIATYFEDK